MERVWKVLKGPCTAAFAAALCLFATCGGERDRDANAAPSAGLREAEIVLRVEDSAYTNGQFLASLRHSAGEEAEALTDEALSRLFDRFVEEKILLEAARRGGVVLTEDEKTAYLTRISADQDVGPAGIDTETADRLFDRLLVDKYVHQLLGNIEVSRAEIREYYNGHRKDFLLAERIQVSQILYETEEEAVGALRRLERAPPEEFRLAARAESIGPEAVKDGLMGVYKPGDLPSDMEKVIFALPEGKLSLVVESAYGYHIFRVDKKLYPHLESEEEAAPEIRLKIIEEKRKQALAAHLEELKNTLDWTVSHKELTFSYQRSEG